MTNIIIIGLLIVLIFKDELKGLRKQKQEEVSKIEEEKQKEFREQFEKLMAYSIEDAIESKKVN